MGCASRRFLATFWRLVEISEKFVVLDSYRQLRDFLWIIILNSLIFVSHELPNQHILLLILVRSTHIGKLSALLADHDVVATLFFGIVVYRIILNDFLS